MRRNQQLESANAQQEQIITSLTKVGSNVTPSDTQVLAVDVWRINNGFVFNLLVQETKMMQTFKEENAAVRQEKLVGVKPEERCWCTGRNVLTGVTERR